MHFLIIVGCQRVWWVAGGILLIPVYPPPPHGGPDEGGGKYSGGEIFGNGVRADPDPGKKIFGAFGAGSENMYPYHKKPQKCMLAKMLYFLTSKKI